METCLPHVQKLTEAKRGWYENKNPCASWVHKFFYRAANTENVCFWCHTTKDYPLREDYTKTNLCASWVHKFFFLQRGKNRKHLFLMSYYEDCPLMYGVTVFKEAMETRITSSGHPICVVICNSLMEKSIKTCTHVFYSFKCCKTLN